MESLSVFLEAYELFIRDSVRRSTREPEQKSGSVALGERHLNPRKNNDESSQSEGFSGASTPKAMVKAASFAAVEAANETSGGGEHNDREKCYSLFSARRPL